MGAFAPPVGGSAPLLAPSEDQNGQKQPFLDFCPLRIAYCPLNAPHRKISGAATDGLVDWIGPRPTDCTWETVQSYTGLIFFSWIQLMHLGTIHKHLGRGVDAKKDVPKIF